MWEHLAQALDACLPYVGEDRALQAMSTKAREHLENCELAAAGRIVLALTHYTPDIRL